MSEMAVSDLMPVPPLATGFIGHTALTDLETALPRSLTDRSYAKAPVPSRTAGDVLILGTRGIPASHGGFETFAQQFSQYLVEHGWNPSVYCQSERTDRADGVFEDSWNGINRVMIPSRNAGSLASIAYDFRCILHASRRPGKVVLLGYNTAIFALLLSLRGRDVIINMDGLEWQRPKWSRAARAWLWLNEKIAAKLSTTMVADHPEIKAHLAQIAPASKIVMIPYGAPAVTEATDAPLRNMGLVPRSFYVCISRIEPENSQLELMRAFAAAPREQTLVMLGKLDPANAYHRAVQQAAGSNVRFTGAIYDKDTLASLRVHAAAYLHGHTVGGTNPSLVEALGAGCAVIAHDNKFNRWTAGSGQFFFEDVATCQAIFDRVGHDRAALEAARAAARLQHRQNFELNNVLRRYERLIGFELQAYCEAPFVSPVTLAGGAPS